MIRRSEERAFRETGAVARSDILDIDFAAGGTGVIRYGRCSAASGQAGTSGRNASPFIPANATGRRSGSRR